MRMPGRRRLLVTTLFTFSTVFLLNTQLRPNGGRANAPKHGNISILIWHWPFNRPYSLQEDVCWDHFRIPGCMLWDDRALYSEADVVVFHHHELKTGRTKLPLNLPRVPTQKWVWLSLESPATNGNLTPYNGVFNWTMTYRRDADIFMPYGEKVRKAKRSGDDSCFAIPKKDPRLLVCWVVSNYRAKHKRSQVYRSLSKLIPVEVYGRKTNRRLTAQQLLATVSRCHFYLAFENSEFRDYITEKLWHNSYLAGTVPVVLGPPRPDYDTLVAPDSFIHVDDFNSTAELAGFLRQLALDRKRYESYFKWHCKYDIEILNDWRHRLCRICRHYHQLPPHKVYHHLDNWSRK